MTSNLFIDSSGIPAAVIPGCRLLSAGTVAGVLEIQADFPACLNSPLMPILLPGRGFAGIFLIFPFSFGIKNLRANPCGVRMESAI